MTLCQLRAFSAIHHRRQRPKACAVIPSLTASTCTFAMNAFTPERHSAALVKLA